MAEEKIQKRDEKSKRAQRCDAIAYAYQYRR